jgi:site-specific DNA recombinase
LHREVYRGVIIWGKTKKRGPDGRTAVTSRPEAEWLRIDKPELRIVSDVAWEAAHRRITAAREQYDNETHGLRRQRRDRDSKYLLTGFGRCAVCNGSLHVRSRPHGGRRAFFYACLSHFSRGPHVCPEAGQWPMEEINAAVLASIGGDVLTPDLVEAAVSEARQQFEAAAQPDDRDRRRRELAAVEREQARLTSALAAGADAPVLVKRLKETEAKRRDLVAHLEAQRDRPAPVWRAIEQRVGKSLETGARCWQAIWRRSGRRSANSSRRRSRSSRSSRKVVAAYGSKAVSDSKRFSAASW